jgi:hypothetical protein
MLANTKSMWEIIKKNGWNCRDLLIQRDDFEAIHFQIAGGNIPSIDKIDEILSAGGWEILGFNTYGEKENPSLSVWAARVETINRRCTNN